MSIDREALPASGGEPDSPSPDAPTGPAETPIGTPTPAPVPSGATRLVRTVGALLRDVLEAVLLAVLVFAGLQLVVQNTEVEGSSMEPGFRDGQRLLVNKLAYRFAEPARGDVIVFHAPPQSPRQAQPGRDFLKRIIALPGESVAVDDGVVRIDGQRLEEPWRPKYGFGSFGPYTVPAGEVFVLGDNRPRSNDSRHWDATGLPREQIVGKAWLSIWPPDTWGTVASDAPGPAHQGAAAE